MLSVAIVQSPSSVACTSVHFQAPSYVSNAGRFVYQSQTLLFHGVGGDEPMHEPATITTSSSSAPAPAAAPWRGGWRRPASGSCCWSAATICRASARTGTAKAVFVDARYQATETWYGSDGKSFHPGLHYFVGGNSKVYGAVLLRLRERDFDEIRHPDGISPAWPLKYDAFEPYYQAAEELYHVHGLRGEDPTEPPSRKPYAYPPAPHEPRIQQLFDGLKREGHHPFHLPVGILLDEHDGKALPHSPCIRCNAFDGYPCLTNGKADAQIICVDPALARASEPDPADERLRRAS